MIFLALQWNKRSPHPPIVPFSDLGCWLGEPSFRHSQRGDFQLIAGATLSKPKETPRSTWREHQPTATQELIVEHVPAGFNVLKINMVAYGCYVSPAWVSTEHITHGSSAASNSAPHLPLFDLEVPSANPTITHQSTVSSHPDPHQHGTWRSHRDDTRSAVGDVSPMLMTRSCYLTLGFAGFVPSPRPTPQKKTKPLLFQLQWWRCWAEAKFSSKPPSLSRQDRSSERIIIEDDELVHLCVNVHFFDSFQSIR